MKLLLSNLDFLQLGSSFLKRKFHNYMYICSRNHWWRRSRLSCEWKIMLKTSCKSRHNKLWQRYGITEAGDQPQTPHLLGHLNFLPSPCHRCSTLFRSQESKKRESILTDHWFPSTARWDIVLNAAASPNRSCDQRCRDHVTSSDGNHVLFERRNFECSAYCVTWLLSLSFSSSSSLKKISR